MLWSGACDQKEQRASEEFQRYQRAPTPKKFSYGFPRCHDLLIFYIVNHIKIGSYILLSGFDSSPINPDPIPITPKTIT